MADGYRIFGAEMSPCSVKVRSYFRYKAIPHQWISRNAASQAEYEKYARMHPIGGYAGGRRRSRLHTDHRPRGRGVLGRIAQLKRCSTR